MASVRGISTFGTPRAEGQARPSRAVAPHGDGGPAGPSRAATRLAAVPPFKAAYLIHGDDHGRIGERRSRLRAMAEAESGSAGVEVFEGDACFAREEGHTKVPSALVKAVEAAGGQVAEEASVKPWHLPRWVAERGSELGLSVDKEAARALVAHVGDRQQRLLRELEKLALEYGDGAHIGTEEVLESCAGSAERKVWTLADAVAAGDRRAAMRALLELREQGERLPGLLYWMVRPPR